jgi:HD-like signal output (HDOD) protein
MVAEVGMLVMARIPDVDELGAAALNDAHVPEVERLLFGGDRFEVGSQLLRLWGFSESIVDAVSALSAETFGPPDGLEWCLSAARRLVIVEGLDETSFALSPGDSPEFDHAVALLVECSSVDA